LCSVRRLQGEFNNRREQRGARRITQVLAEQHLPDAIAFLRHAGLKDQLFFVKLVMVGAANTQPLAAWTIASLADRSLFPIALDAQTGKIIPWVRAYNPPPFTDAQMRAAWNQVLHPPSSNGNNAQKNLDCFMAVQEFGFCGN